MKFLFVCIFEFLKFWNTLKISRGSSKSGNFFFEVIKFVKFVWILNSKFSKMRSITPLLNQFLFNFIQFRNGMKTVQLNQSISILKIDAAELSTTIYTICSHSYILFAVLLKWLNCWMMEWLTISQSLCFKPKCLWIYFRLLTYKSAIEAVATEKRRKESTRNAP